MIKKTVKINSYEVFPEGNIKLSCLMKHFQQLARDDVDQCGATYGKMKNDDMVFVITRFGIEFNSEIRVDDEIEILTANTAINGITFNREFIIYKNNEVAARATTHWVLMSFVKRSLLRPSVLTDKYGFPDCPTGIDGVSLPRKLCTEEASFEGINEHKVRYSELDENCHMNNTVYADLVFDYAPCPINRSVLSCHIHFSGEARYGDIIKISGRETDNGFELTGVNGQTNKRCFGAAVVFRN